MENISLLIVTDENEYGKALGMALLSACKNFVIKIFAKQEFIKRNKYFLKERSDVIFSEQFDLILWDGDEVKEIYKGNLIFMAEKPSMFSKNFTDKRFCLYKYSDGRKLAGELFDIYSSITGRHPIKSSCGSSEFLAFTSWSGGTGCSTVSMAVGQELSRFYGKKVFYFSLEELESTGEFINSFASAKSLGHYLYMLFKDKEGIQMHVKDGEASYMPFMESYVVSDDFGIEAFSPTDGRNPLCFVSREELCTFINSISENGRYDVIIADVGQAISEAAIACLQMAEKICAVSATAGGTREAQYLQYLMTRCGESVVNKIVKVRNMVDRKYLADVKNDEEISEREPIHTDIFIERSRLIAEENGVKKIFLDGDFGHKINLLTKSMTEPSHI